jgi:hypothetical protein
MTDRRTRVFKRAYVDTERASNEAFVKKDKANTIRKIERLKARDSKRSDTKGILYLSGLVL